MAGEVSDRLAMTAPVGPAAGEMHLGRLGRRSNAASLEGIDLAGVRSACGIRQKTMGAALGVSPKTVSTWEGRTKRPPQAYCRVIAGLLRHLAVTWDEEVP